MVNKNRHFTSNGTGVWGHGWKLHTQMSSGAVRNYFTRGVMKKRNESFNNSANLIQGCKNWYSATKTSHVAVKIERQWYKYWEEWYKEYIERRQNFLSWVIRFTMKLGELGWHKQSETEIGKFHEPTLLKISQGCYKWTNSKTWLRLPSKESGSKENLWGTSTSQWPQGWESCEWSVVGMRIGR